MQGNMKYKVVKLVPYGDWRENIHKLRPKKSFTHFYKYKKKHLYFFIVKIVLEMLELITQK